MWEKKIHSGRSRNDQVLLDLKLFTRTEIKEIAEAVSNFSMCLSCRANVIKCADAGLYSFADSDAVVFRIVVWRLCGESGG